MGQKPGSSETFETRRHCQDNASPVYSSYILVLAPRSCSLNILLTSANGHREGTMGAGQEPWREGPWIFAYRLSQSSSVCMKGWRSDKDADLIRHNSPADRRHHNAGRRRSNRAALTDN